MMEATRTSETSVDIYFTRQYIPEDKSELHTRRLENLRTVVRKVEAMLVLCKIVCIQTFLFRTKENSCLSDIFFCNKLIILNKELVTALVYVGCLFL
jgi:hypothetical protein